MATRVGENQGVWLVVGRGQGAKPLLGIGPKRISSTTGRHPSSRPVKAHEQKPNPSQARLVQTDLEAALS